MVKNLSVNADARHVREAGLIPRSGRSPGKANGNPLQYSCLENPLDRGAWQAAVHRVTELDTTEATQHVTTHLVEGNLLYLKFNGLNVNQI